MIDTRIKYKGFYIEVNFKPIPYPIVCEWWPAFLVNKDIDDYSGSAATVKESKIKIGKLLNNLN